MIEQANMTATEVSNNALKNIEKSRIVRKLLDDLLEFARPKNGATHSDGLEWFDNIINGGPGKLIIDAIAENPDLWIDSLPEGVIIVPTTAITEMGYDLLVAEYFNDCGVYMVRQNAAKIANNQKLAQTHEQT